MRITDIRESVAQPAVDRALADAGPAGGGRDGVGREQGKQGQLLRLGEGWFLVGGRHGKLAGRLELAGSVRI